ncbi:MAG: hypothetical protein WCG09_00630 [Halobacteriota archaeon]
MKKDDRATISVSKKTHADFEEFRAKLSAEIGKVQTQEDAVRVLLEQCLLAKQLDSQRADTQLKSR